MTTLIDRSATFEDGMLTVYGTLPVKERGNYVLDRCYPFYLSAEFEGTFNVFKNIKKVEMWKVQILIGNNIYLWKLPMYARDVRTIIKNMWK